jgi:hypothetical protein
VEKRNPISISFNKEKDDQSEWKDERSDLLSVRGNGETGSNEQWESEYFRRSPSLPLSRSHKRNKNDLWKTKGYRARENKDFFMSLKKSSKVLLIAGSAIGVGLLFGMIALSIFSNLSDGKAEPTAIVNKNNQDPSTPQDSRNQDKTPTSEDTNLDGASSESGGESENPQLVPTGQVQGNIIELPSRSYYVVQAGAFTEESAGKMMIEEYKQKGWPGMLLGEKSPYRLYVGMSQTKEGAMLVGRYFQEQNVQIYVKEHLTLPVSQVEVQAKEEVLQLLPAFLAKGDQLVAKLGEISSNGIMDAEYELKLEEWNRVQELHRNFIQEGKPLFSNWPGKQKQIGEQMIRHLNIGVNALETYRKQSHVTYLWQVQQASLQYLNEYEQMVSSFVE